MTWSIRLEFKPQDLWIGVYWRRGRRGRKWDLVDALIRPGPREVLDVWVCLVPMLPIHVRAWWPARVEMREVP